MDKLDILNREEFVEKLFNLTQQLSFNKKNTTFAIDGSWGVGKSFVLDMYEDKLSQEQSEETNNNRYFVIRYNCWKYDYYEEPLIAIVSAMIETIEQKTKLFPDNEKKSKILGGLKAVGLSLLSMANSAIREKTGIDLKKAYNAVKYGVDEGVKEYEEKHDYDVYFGFNKAMNALQRSLAELSNDYSVTHIGNEVFSNCNGLKSVSMSENLHVIGEQAFFASGLSDICLPSSLQEIHSSAFYHCEYLTRIVIPDSVIFIGEKAFGLNDNLNIYCQAISQPTTWEENWNSSDCNVIWGYKAS